MNGKWQYPHRRWNPLRQSWVMVSPHRTQRPWQGEVAQKASPSGVAYDPACYLCPGNKRASGDVNPQYDSVFAFVNDYAALLPELPVGVDLPAPIYVFRILCKIHDFSFGDEDWLNGHSPQIINFVRRPHVRLRRRQGGASQPERP